MYLDKKLKNRYTIGKTLRAYKRLRKADPDGRAVDMPPELQDYTNQLFKNGLQVDGLKFAQFKTKNGLPYPGLIATKKILTNTILVKVPVQLLLTTRDAFLSDIEKIFVQNPGFFAKRFTSDWEDRILLAYLLYQYQKGEKSRWFNLIRNLPKQIDYAIFWNKQSIQYLQDEWIGRNIVREKQKFENECSQMIKILKNYPQFFDGATITRQNVIWIHTHLVTRCFGKYFEYTTMVPFAELFNHECADVYYTMYYKPGNPHTENEEFYQQKQLTQEQMDQCDSSDGSYEADDFEQDDQFIHFDPKYSVDWQKNLQKSPQILKDLRSIRIHIFTFLNFSDSVSFSYLSQMLQKLTIATQIQDQEDRKQVFQQIHNSNVKYIRKVKQMYNKINKKYYSYSIRQKRKPQNQDNPKDEPVKGQNYFATQWPKDKFDQFYMLCSTKDQFQEGSQVFFCYGRLPNKLLLMRYGIALEHNKYDHMFLKIDVTQQILTNQYCREVLTQIQIKKYKRFKVKRTKFCIQLVVYFRSLKWIWGERLEKYFGVSNIQRQVQTLLEAKNLYKEHLTKYSHSLQQNLKKLYDKSLGYHKHFALIYKIEQQRILLAQIQMIQYALQIIKKIKQGGMLKDILLAEKDHEKITMQIMMEPYFKMFQIGMAKKI